MEIDNEEKKIKFKCMNNDKEKNHNIQIMLINEYIKEMEKYTFLYDECSICHKKQNSNKNLSIFKYCTKCNLILCSTCLEKHIKNNNKEEHLLINNNEKKNKLFNSS